MPPVSQAPRAGGGPPPSGDSRGITPEIFNHLVELAAFHLGALEADYLRAQLNAQLKAIGELEAIELPPDVPITSHGVPYTSAISREPRADAIEPFPAADDILAQAPQTEGRYIVVPDIPHTELS